MGFEGILFKAFNVINNISMRVTNSGKCGENVTWSLNNSELIISGTGVMHFLHCERGNAPWSYNSSSIQKVVIHDGVTTIDGAAFKNCTSLMEIKIPDSVTLIWYDAFNNCTSLTEIKIPDSVTEISLSAFQGCTNLTEIKIPDGVTKIDGWTFDGCKRLTSITIPNSVTDIGELAFNDCASLTEIKIPDNVTGIGREAFRGCTSLKSVTIPDGVPYIDGKTFYGCTSLTEITIPNTIKYIGNWAFRGCTSLTSVTIPDSVTKIGEKAFCECTSLEKIYYKAGSGWEGVLCYGNDAELIPYTNAPPTAAKPKAQPARKSSPQTSAKSTTPASVIKPTTQSAAEKLHWKVDGINLTVGGVRVIENCSWYNLLSISPSDIQRIVIEEGVEEISANALADFVRLERLIIPASVKTVGDFAFNISFCGDKKFNGGKNVFWSLEDGVLMIKKNPAAKSDANFSTGYESWEAVEKNITGIKIARGIVPGKRFFDWLNKISSDIPVVFS